MSTTTLSDEIHAAAALPSLWTRLFGHERVLAATGFLMLYLMVPTGFAALMDERVFGGVDIWVKPLKFQASIAVYALTLAFFARYLPERFLSGWRYRVYAASLAAAAFIEIAWVMGAALLGTASHFNPSPFGMAIYPIMGVLAVLLTTGSTVYAWQIFRNPAPGLAPAVREAVVLGLALVLPLTLLTAGTMAEMGSHHVGGEGTEAGLAVFGWAREAGDLRVAHFLATHAMHFIPAAGLAASWAFGRDARWAARLIALLFVGLTLFTFAQALAGRPFLPMLG